MTIAIGQEQDRGNLQVQSSDCWSLTRGPSGKPDLIVVLRRTPLIRLGRLSGVSVLPGSSIKTPKVRLGYHPFKRMIMRH
jgi:hypothetical protein